MAIQAYAQLSKDGGVTWKWLRVIHGSLVDSTVQEKTMNRTLTGAGDKQYGAAYRKIAFTTRINYSETGSWCTLSDLKTFLTSDTPGDQTLQLKLNDDSETINVFATSDYVPQNLVPKLDGTGSAFLIPLEFEQR